MTIYTKNGFQEIIWACGEGARASVVGNVCVVVAGDGAKAWATGEGAEAWADGKGAEARATGDGARAEADGYRARAWVNGVLQEMVAV